MELRTHQGPGVGTTLQATPHWQKPSLIPRPSRATSVRSVGEPRERRKAVRHHQLVGQRAPAKAGTVAAAVSHQKSEACRWVISWGWPSVWGRQFVRITRAFCSCWNHWRTLKDYRCRLKDCRHHKYICSTNVIPYFFI